MEHTIKDLTQVPMMIKTIKEQHFNLLSDWEKKFINDQYHRIKLDPEHVFTDNQLFYIERIWVKCP